VTALERYAVANVPGLTAPLSVRQFKIGQSNPTFLLVDGAGRRYVLRKKPGGQLVATAHMIEREYQVLKALKTVDFPVPTVYCLCEDTSIIGTPFYVRPRWLPPTQSVQALTSVRRLLDCMFRRSWSFWSAASWPTRGCRTSRPKIALSGMLGSACAQGSILLA